jgi:fumarate hydratase subunit beta
MITWRLKTPIEEKEVRRVKIGDILYVTGIAITARDEAHIRALDYIKVGKEIPVEFRGLVVYHCGPLVRGNDKSLEVLAAGPTTSMRMEPLEAKFIENFRPSVIIGKGGMGKKTANAAEKFGTLYCEFTGGAAVLAAKAVEEIQGVEWLDLGMAEAMWILKMKEFGPLIVTIDCSGKNLHDELIREVEKRKTAVLGL